MPAAAVPVSRPAPCPPAATRPALLLVWLLAVTLAHPPAVKANGQPAGVPPEVPLSELSVRAWMTDDGLPSNSLINVIQTARGYIWVASYDGLARFDGIAFELFDRTQAPLLASGTGGFYELIEKDGTLWIGTRGSGVWYYEGGRFQPLSRDQPPGITVRSLAIDRDGTIWIGTAARGVLRFEEGRFIPLSHPRLTNVMVRAILEDHRGALWFGTEGEGLTRLDDNGFRTWTAATGLASDNVNGLWQDAAGVLWVGTSDGLTRIAGERADAVPALDGVEIFRLIGDGYGSLWLATEQGLYRRNGPSGEFEHLNELRGLSLRSLSAIAFDREGGVWIASYVAGLLRLSQGRFKNYTTRDGLASQRINGVYQRRDGSILAGADGGVVHVVQSERVSRLALHRPLPDVRVRHFLEDSRGRLWVASYAGLLRIDGHTQTLLTVGDGLPTNQVRFTYEDRHGRLWAGTRNRGLLRLREEGGFDVFDQTTGLASDFILSLAEDRQDNLVIGSQNGLMVMTPRGELRTYTVADGLPSDVIFNTHIDEDGAIWVCGTGGLARLAEGRVQAITTREGLPADSVFDYEVDDEGNAWLSSSRGLIRLDRQSVDEVLAGRRQRVEAELFDRSDGMASQQCTGATSMARAADGRLWIPTLGGISVIDPANIPLNAVPPPVDINRLAIDHRELGAAELVAGPIEVPAGARRLVIGFSALSFRAPEQVRVRYRLQGFDLDWIEDTGSRRSAVYTNLPPGKLLFQVIAANDDGVWNRQGAALTLRIQPRLHQTLSFRMAALAALVLLLWGIFRWRTAAIQKRNLRLQRLLAEQQRLEVERQLLIQQLASRNEQLEHLTRAVSHDLKSPLVTIRGFLGLLAKDLAAGRSARAADDMGRIREAASAMGQLLEQLSRLWRVEHREGEPEELAWSELAHQAVDLLAGRLSEQRILVQIEPGMPKVIGDRVQLLEVLQNLIDNAAKFMGDQPRPRIEVGCRRQERPVVFFVRDNGVGIDRADRAKVFGLFEKLGRRGSGTGIGLTIVKRIIEAHGGRIWIESGGASSGAAFCFTLESGRVAETVTGRHAP